MLVQMNNAANVGLIPVSNAEELAISEGLKAAYLSYGKAGLKPREAWGKIAAHVGIYDEQRAILEQFNGQSGRPLFAAKAAVKGLDGIQVALHESFQMRKESN